MSRYARFLKQQPIGAHYLYRHSRDKQAAGFWDSLKDVAKTGLQTAAPGVGSLATSMAGSAGKAIGQHAPASISDAFKNTARHAVSTAAPGIGHVASQMMAPSSGSLGQRAMGVMGNSLDTVQRAAKGARGAAYAAGGGILGAASMPARLLGRASDATGLTSGMANTADAMSNSLWSSAGAGAKDLLGAVQPGTGNQPSYVSNKVQRDANLMRQQGSPGMAAATEAAKTVGDYAGMAAAGGVVGGASGAANAIGMGVPAYEYANAVANGGQPATPQQSAPQQSAPQQPAAKQPASQQQPGQQPQPQEAGQPQPPGTDPVGDATKQMTDFAQQFPEEAQHYVDQAGAQMKNALNTEAGKKEVESAMNNGQLTPDAEESVFSKLSTMFGDNVEKAQEAHANMDVWSKVALWGGLGIGLIGLVNALSGEGGIGSWILPMLGLGTAAISAGNAGMLGETAQNAIKNTGTGLGNTAISAALNAPDEIAVPAMGLLQHMYPDRVNDLDTAAGIGGMGNAVKGFLGGVTGTTDRRLAEYGIDTPEKSKRLLDLWTKYRNQG